MEGNTPLENLSVLELNTMLKHVRLGKEHLTKHLKAEEFKRFLQLTNLSEQQKERIHTNGQEKAGNVAVILNAVITGILGAMLGMSGYLGFKLSSLPILLGVLSFCALASLWIGYYSYKLTYKKAQETVITKKLRLIELKIIDLINEKRRTEIEKIANKIIEVLYQFDESLEDDEARKQQFVQMLTAKEDVTKWDEILEDIVSHRLPKQLDHNIETFIHKKLANVLSSIKQLAQKLDSQHAALQDDDSSYDSDYSFSDYVAGRSLTSASYLKVLTSPSLENEKIVPRASKWFKNNILVLLAGVGPVLFGSFGSMFVFLTGTPQVMKSFGQYHIVNIWLAPHTKLIGLTMAVTLISYYGYSYIYSNYKNFLRQKEVEKTEKSIAEQNAILLKISLRHNVLAQILTYMEELVFIHGLLKLLNTSK